MQPRKGCLDADIRHSHLTDRCFLYPPREATMNIDIAARNGAQRRSEDPRVERTRARLAEAVLALAAERDITTASVSELTRRAGVNRSTFYAHADTPVELLTRVLAAELDDVRDRKSTRLNSSH